jgi:hypothetical protein
MDLVKELVERSLGETGPGRESDGRAEAMRSSLADRDEDEPSTPSGSPTRSSTRPVEVPSTRPSKFDFDGAVMLPCLCCCSGGCCWSHLLGWSCFVLFCLLSLATCFLPAGDAQADAGGVSRSHGGMSSPLSPQVALARSLSEQERLRRANAEAQAQLAWSEGDAIAHELQELQHEIDTAGRSSR